MPEKVAGPSYPCPLNFLASMSLSARKAFSAANIEAVSQAERLTSPKKCYTSEPKLSTHLKQIESSSIVAIYVDSSARIECSFFKRSESTLLDPKANGIKVLTIWRHESLGISWSCIQMFPHSSSPFSNIS